MNKLVILFFAIVVLSGCDKKSDVEKAIEQIPVSVTVWRFDKDFYESTPQDLPELKQKYPFFFPHEDDEVWAAKMQDTLWREVYDEVRKKFGDFNAEQQQLEDFFKRHEYYFPGAGIPDVYTLVGEMDYHAKTLYAQDKLLISLELFLGRDHRFYQGEFPEYIRHNFDPRQMLPDVATAMLQHRVSRPENTLISQMIYQGKLLYAKDLLLSDEYSDAEKIGYRDDQIEWAKDNEAYIWRYLLEGQLLYETDPKLGDRFINPAPFSKFYLEIDNESPGRIGAWIGWQIVRAYARRNPEVSLADLLARDGKMIFEQSRYKPQKNG